MKCEKRKRFRVLVAGIVLILAGSLSAAQGQADWRISGKSLPELRRDTLLSVPSVSLFRSPFKPWPSSLRPVPVFPAFQQHTSRMPTIYDFYDLAFFCRIEVRLEQASGLPVKFRLGEVEAVEKLEGKWKW